MKMIQDTSVEERLRLLRGRWDAYLGDGRFETFIEFAIALNSLAEHFNRMRLPGLMRLCEGLENAVLGKLGDQSAHPLAAEAVQTLTRQLDTLFGSVALLRTEPLERRTQASASLGADEEWIKPRAVWVVSAPQHADMVLGLSQQLQFFGFQYIPMAWGQDLPGGEAPLAVLFIPAGDTAGEAEIADIARVRANCPGSQLFYLGVQSMIEPVVALMRAGIDVAIPASEQTAMVLNRILDLVQSSERESYRVLLVEDSRVAVALIQRTLRENGIDSRAINNPSNLLETLESYRPDLILMDMHMPRFNGVEATRVLRQMSAYHDLPIVYLSGESDVSMQVEALRLGGDQFLGKPFNPVLLAAVVKTKIARFREVQRSSRLDGLTGLFNHTAAKSLLKSIVEQMGMQQRLTVAMIDIDFFKAVNDTYGHPVGDQVIRGLAWLLKGRLRSGDLIGRYGGEEFIVALPQIAPEQAWSVIDRIREDFAALPHVHAGGALYTTFSAGLAHFPLVASAEGLTEAADAALLEAKRQGRNRVLQAV